MYNYSIIRSKRKTIALQINIDGELIVRAPMKYPESNISKFVEGNSEWIEKSLKKQKVLSDNKVELSDDDIVRLKKMAKEIIPQKVEYYSNIMGVTPTGIKITSAQTRFGSCSGKNSLCFSYMLMLYPDDAVDYVVVHELAHIIEHNHSKKFYEVIRKTMPFYSISERKLKGLQIKPF